MDVEDLLSQTLKVTVTKPDGLIVRKENTVVPIYLKGEILSCRFGRDPNQKGFRETVSVKISRVQRAAVGYRYLIRVLNENIVGVATASANTLQLYNTKLLCVNAVRYGPKHEFEDIEDAEHHLYRFGL